MILQHSNTFLFTPFKDQHDDTGKYAMLFHHLVTLSDPRYPGHRGMFGYICMYFLLILFMVLGIVGAAFENFLLLVIALPCFIILVSVDCYYLSDVYRILGFWHGLTAIMLGVFAFLTGVAYVVLLHIRGPVPYNQTVIGYLFADDDDENRYQVYFYRPTK